MISQLIVLSSGFKKKKKKKEKREFLCSWRSQIIYIQHDSEFLVIWYLVFLTKVHSKKRNFDIIQVPPGITKLTSITYLIKNEHVMFFALWYVIWNQCYLTIKHINTNYLRILHRDCIPCHMQQFAWCKRRRGVVVWNEEDHLNSEMKETM